jgi:hypothetical protein
MKRAFINTKLLMGLVGDLFKAPGRGYVALFRRFPRGLVAGVGEQWGAMAALIVGSAPLVFL